MLTPHCENSSLFKRPQGHQGHQCQVRVPASKVSLFSTLQTETAEIEGVIFFPHISVDHSMQTTLPPF